MVMRKIDVLNNLKGHALWPQSYHLSEAEAEVCIKALEQEPKTGHWIRELIRNEKGGCIGAKMICSECGNDNKHDEYMHYCPNCGAKMVEPQEI